MAHFGYWYVPRLRPARASESRLLSELMPADLRLWLPYPHQNLPALAVFFDDPSAMVLAGMRLGGFEIEQLPTLGSFGIPPSTELLVASDVAIRRPYAAVRPFTTIRLGAKASGRLASNPWLSGGVVDTGSESVRVEWDRGNWLLSRTEDSSPRAENGSEAVVGSSGASLARLEVLTSELPLPPGGYQFLRRGLGFSIVSDVSFQPPSVAPLVELGELALLQLEAEDSVELRLLFNGALRKGDLPSAAVFAIDLETAFDGLPGGKLLGRIDNLPSAALAEGVLIASDRRGFEQAMASRDSWMELIRHAEKTRTSGVWVRLAHAREITGDLADLLEDVPLISPREARRWRDVNTILKGLRAFQTVSGWWDAAGGELRLE